MTGKTHLIIPDPHSHPDHNNDRADWIGKLIKEVKPDLVMNMGDTADLPSLSSFDKGKASFHGASYAKDINAHLDFQERLWAPMKKSKKKRPHRVILEGNHERRINTVLEQEPHLASGGTGFGISYRDLDFESYYDDIHWYRGGTPAVATYDDIAYAHFFISGVMGRAMGGANHASTMLNKNHCSSTCAHSHLLDFAVQTDARGKKMMGLVAGVGQDYNSGWAGDVNRLWWQGVIIKRNVADGLYDPQFVSMNTLRKEYG